MPKFRDWVAGRTAVTIADNDELYVRDDDANDSKRITWGNAKAALAADAAFADQYAPIDGVSLYGRPPTDISANQSWGMLPGQIISATVGTTVYAGGALTYIPFVVDHPAGITLDSLMIEVTTAATAGSTARIVIANADSSWQPTALVVELSTMAIDAPAQVSLTSIGQSLPRGRYLLGIRTSANATLRRVGIQTPDGPWMAPAGWGTSPFVILAQRATSNPETVPNYNSITVGSTPGLLSPFMARWTVNP
jgi:hypothetical protein